MSNANIVNVIAVVPVKDHSVAVTWYAQLLGRAADLVPDEGVAEWQIADGAWIQVGLDPDRAGSTTVIIGVRDLEAQRRECESSGVTLGETVEYPDIIRMAEAEDPDGNKVAFVQDLTSGA